VLRDGGRGNPVPPFSAWIGNQGDFIVIQDPSHVLAIADEDLAYLSRGMADSSLVRGRGMTLTHMYESS
jgi:hypothetical protein